MKQLTQTQLTGGKKNIFSESNSIVFLEICLYNLQKEMAVIFTNLLICTCR